MTTRLTTPQVLLDLIELAARNHLLALNALGIRWVREVKR